MLYSTYEINDQNEYMEKIEGMANLSLSNFDYVMKMYLNVFYIMKGAELLLVLE